MRLLTAILIFALVIGCSEVAPKEFYADKINTSVEEAEKYLNKGANPDVIQLMSEAIEATHAFNPATSHPIGYLYLLRGKAYYRSDQVELATKDFREGLKTNMYDGETNYSLAYLLIELADKPEHWNTDEGWALYASELVERAVTGSLLTGSLGDAQRLKSMFYMGMGDYETAKRSNSLACVNGNEGAESREEAHIVDSWKSFTCKPHIRMDVFNDVDGARKIESRLLLIKLDLQALRSP